MKVHWCISGVVAITVSAFYLFSRTALHETVEHPIITMIERPPDFVPVENIQPRVTLDLGCEPFNNAVPSSPEVKSPEPPSAGFPLRSMAAVLAGGAEEGIVKTLPIPKPVAQAHRGQALLTPLIIRWPDRTPKHLTGKVRVVVNYDSHGLIDSLRLESEYPANLGFGESVVRALQEKRITTSQSVRLTYEIHIRYGERPEVKFASSGVEVIQ